MGPLPSGNAKKFYDNWKAAEKRAAMYHSWYREAQSKNIIYGCCGILGVVLGIVFGFM